MMALTVRWALRAHAERSAVSAHDPAESVDYWKG